MAAIQSLIFTYFGNKKWRIKPFTIHAMQFFTSLHLPGGLWYMKRPPILFVINSSFRAIENSASKYYGTYLSKAAKRWTIYACNFIYSPQGVIHQIQQAEGRARSGVGHYVVRAVENDTGRLTLLQSREVFPISSRHLIPCNDLVVSYGQQVKLKTLSCKLTHLGKLPLIGNIR